MKTLILLSFALALAGGAIYTTVNAVNAATDVFTNAIGGKVE